METTTPVIMSANEVKDIFPTKIFTTEHLEQQSTVKFLSQDSFKNHAVQAQPFILFKFLNDDTLSYYGGNNSTTSIMDQHRGRLYRLLKNCTQLNVRTGRENVAWSKLDDTFKKLPISLRKQQTTRKIKNPGDSFSSSNTKEREEHADIRLGFRFDNMYAVKANFTFGERKTAPNEFHLIQTSDVPLLYNEPKEEFKSMFLSAWSSSSREGRFDPSDQKYFKTYVLNPFSTYLIPQNTVYVLISVQKTLFALDRVTCESLNILQSMHDQWQRVSFKLPNSDKNLMAEIDTPPPTKRIKLCDEDGGEEEYCWVYNDELKPPQFMVPNNINHTLIHFQPSQQDEKEEEIIPSSHNSNVDIFFNNFFADDENQKLSSNNDSTVHFQSTTTSEDTTNAAAEPIICSPDILNDCSNHSKNDELLTSTTTDDGIILNDDTTTTTTQFQNYSADDLDNLLNNSTTTITQSENFSAEDLDTLLNDSTATITQLENYSAEELDNFLKTLLSDDVSEEKK